jgi:hypothetical protein
VLPSGSKRIKVYEAAASHPTYLQMRLHDVAYDEEQLAVTEGVGSTEGPAMHNQLIQAFGSSRRCVR